MPKARRPAVADPEADPNAVAVAEETEVPVDPNRTLQDGFPNPKVLGFWEYVKALTPEQWDHHAVYVYRKKPRTELLDGAPGKYIGILTEDFNAQDLKDEFGGGTYKLYLNRDNKEVMTTRISIEGAPKLTSYEKLLEEGPQQASARASGDQWAGQLVDHLKGELSDAREQGREVDPSAAMRKTMELMTEGQRLAMQSVLASMPKQPNMVEMVTAFASLQKVLSPAPTGGVLETITLLKELGVIGESKKTDPLGDLRNLLGLMKELREADGGDAGAHRFDWREKALDTLGSALPKLLDRGAQIAENVRRAQEAATLRATGRLPYNPAVPTTATAVPASPPVTAASGAVGQEPHAANQPQPGETTYYTPTEEQRAAAWTFYKTKVLELLLKGENGERAADVMEALDEDFALWLRDTIRNDLGLLLSDPILGKAQQVPADQLRAFAAAYIGYFDAPPDHQAEN